MGTQLLVRWGIKGVILTMSLLVVIDSASAETLQLRLKARVASVGNGFNPIDLSPNPPWIPVAVGQTFDFYLTIDSTPIPGSEFQNPTLFRALIGGVEIQHPRLNTQVLNDTLLDPTTLAIPGAVDADQAIADALLIQNRIGPYNAGFVTAQPAISFETRIYFEEFLQLPVSLNPTVLQSSMLPGASAVWEQFSFREMDINFSNYSFLGAYVETVTVVPEPASVLLLGISCLYGLEAKRGRRMRRRSFVSQSVTFDSPGGKLCIHTCGKQLIPYF